MWEKIKAFFQNPITIIVESVLIAICSVGLIIGGVTAESIAKIPALAGGIVLAVLAIIEFIRGLIVKKK